MHELRNKRTQLPDLLATFFRKDDQKIEVNSDEYYRISLELKGELRSIQWVIYDLHPELDRVERKSDRRPFQLWVNCRADYRIRVRLSDGREISEWLVDALKKRESGRDAAREIEKLEKRPSPFKDIRDWSRSLDALARRPSKASAPQEYLRRSGNPVQ